MTESNRTRLRVALLVAAGFLGSVLQVHLVSARDIRLEAMAAVFDGQHTYMGDPGPAISAAYRRAHDPDARLYDASLEVGSAFIYPPLAAWLYSPLAELPSDEAHRALLLVNHLLLIGIFLVLLRLLAGRGSLSLLQVGFALVGIALFYPLLHAVELNQSMVFAAFLIGLAFVAVDSGRELLAGVAVACAFLVKPQLALMLPLLAWHARRVIWGAAATALVLLAGSLLYAGVANHLDYVSRVLAPLSRGYSYYANQSWNGLFNRLFAAQDIGVFKRPPGIAAAQILASVMSAATYLAALGFIYRWRRVPELRIWIFALAWLSVTLVSPISWQHHYAPALFVFALLCRDLGEESQRLWLPLTLAFSALAGYLEVRQLEGPIARLLASYLFFGGLLFAGTLAWYLERLGQRPVTGRASP